jgi:hypothetical protein
VLARFSPFRLFITMLLVVSMPLCCCSLRAVIRLGPRCSASIAEHAGRTIDDSGSCCHRAHDHDDASSEPTPSKPKHSQGDQCACGKGLGFVGKPSVKIPALTIMSMMAIMPLPALPLSNPVLAPVATNSAHELLIMPITSLLRLHCALTV